MRRLIMAATLAATVALAGCTVMNLRNLEEPKVSVQDVRVKGLGLTGGSVDIRLNVHNPNRFRLDATQLSYELWIDSVRFGSGTTSERFLVNAGESALVTLPLDFTWSGVGNAAQTMMQTGTLPYRVAGNIRVNSGLGGVTVPYDRSGRFSPLSGSGR